MLSPRVTTAEVGVHRSDTLGEVKFRFDSAVLPESSSQVLAGVARFAATHPNQRIVLDAFCDPIGTSPYNTQLAIRRADAVRKQLSTLGVQGEQIVFAIYGKDGAHRARYADDRRVTAWASREPLANVIVHKFAAHGTAITWQRPMTTAQLEAAPEPVATR
jgi:outer membrane protein OmpA-like peptidoglycan-associated protein